MRHTLSQGRKSSLVRSAAVVASVIVFHSTHVYAQGGKQPDQCSDELAAACADAGEAQACCWGQGLCGACMPETCKPTDGGIATPLLCVAVGVCREPETSCADKSEGASCALPSGSEAGTCQPLLGTCYVLDDAGVYREGSKLRCELPRAPADAGSPTGPAPATPSDGGGGCSATAAGAPGGSAFAALGAVLLLARRRRRD